MKRKIIIFHSNQSKGLIPLFFLSAMSERLSVVVVYRVAEGCMPPMLAGVGFAYLLFCCILETPWGLPSPQLGWEGKFNLTFYSTLVFIINI